MEDKTKSTLPDTKEKIKAFEPHIVVNRDADNPYYMIMYYDVSDKLWHLGFGSFNLSFVIQWLQEEFEEVDVEFAEVKHGEWIRPTKLADMMHNVPHCSICGEVPCDEGKYCPNCGAKMDGGKEE